MILFVCVQEIHWVDQEGFSRLSHPADTGDLSVGDTAEVSRDANGRSLLSESFIAPPESPSVQRQDQKQHQKLHNHKPNEKR